MMYLQFLLIQGNITMIRHTFDRALQSLPITQHNKIWDLYIQFAMESEINELYIRIMRRYLMFRPFDREKHIQFLLDKQLYDEAVQQLMKLLDPIYNPLGKTNTYSNFMRLCDVISRHPGKVNTLDIDAVLRSGIKRFTNEVGKLWCALAEYYIRAGIFDKARDIYEEALGNVITVRDFATIYDAYVQFEEALLTTKLSESKVTVKPQTNTTVINTHDENQLVDPSTIVLDIDDTDLRIARLELLIDRRPLLLSSVLLRQNPHNVPEWQKRIKLLQDNKLDAKVIYTYGEAVRIVDPEKAIGKPHTLYINWAKFYEEHNDIENARAVFRQGTEQEFLKPDDNAAVWCEWTEMEIRLKNYTGALRVVQQAITPLPPNSIINDKFGSKHKTHRNLKLWELYLDLEESLGTISTVKAAYDQVIQLRVATPQMILNYATYLEGKNYFEDSFKAYEKGINIFPWPHLRSVWIAYLRKFIERYGSSELERCRELFEQAVSNCPATEAFLLYSLYADFEEKHGSVRHAMAIYDRATKVVDTEHLYELFLAYIHKVEEYFGAPRTRELYERAIDKLPETQIKDMCMRFATMETKLGEIERARAIYTHASSYCDPAIHILFWKNWQEWETAHGTEETYRDMLRIKRAVTSQYSTTQQQLQSIINPPATASVSNVATSNTSNTDRQSLKRTRDDEDTNVSNSSISSLNNTDESIGALQRFKQRGLG